MGSRRLRLENLFVPIHIDVTVEVNGEQKQLERQSVGTVLAVYPRLALLAAPGGGKSTLLKRLAVAYADPARRENVADNLPSRTWFPLFFRCRELRGLARASFAELLEALSQREPVRQYATVFRSYVDRELLAGRVLLLVDGLDEISDPGDRAAFVCTIRTVLQAYPGIAIVVTSREAGFRHVAAHLSPVCTQATVSTFDPDDIRRLSVAWHQEVVGDTEKVRTDAEHLANTIVQNDRINRLAVNPLLLTTLLLVKRWVGSLPTRRAVLYGKAVEVLLMTWNTEGHDPIPEEEALPQLCYVASEMMLSKVERISRRRLAVLIQEARDALPTELGYVKGTVEEFIHRVEDRSSLLMMTGLDVEDGQLVEFFEFRHLTFQEFLAARAMVDGWHPGRNEGDTLVSVLEPYFEDEKWREVIPLAAVMGGKATEALINRLTEIVHAKANVKDDDSTFIALVNCLADEAAARPETIRAAILELVRSGCSLTQQPSCKMLCRGRYGGELREEAENAFMSASEDLVNPARALIATITGEFTESLETEALLAIITNYIAMLDSKERLARCKGALCFGTICNELGFRVSDVVPKILSEVFSNAVFLIEHLLFEPYLQEQSAAAYALGAIPIARDEPSQYVLDRLVWLWRKSNSKVIRGEASNALINQPISTRRQEWNFDSLLPEEIEKIFLKYHESHNLEDQAAALVVGWYCQGFSDTELKQHAHALLKRFTSFDPIIRNTLNALLVQLGEEPQIIASMVVPNTTPVASWLQ